GVTQVDPVGPLPQLAEPLLRAGEPLARDVEALLGDLVAHRQPHHLLGPVPTVPRHRGNLPTVPRHRGNLPTVPRHRRDRGRRLLAHRCLLRPRRARWARRRGWRWPRRARWAPRYPREG